MRWWINDVCRQRQFSYTQWRVMWRKRWLIVDIALRSEKWQRFLYLARHVLSVIEQKDTRRQTLKFAKPWKSRGRIKIASLERFVDRDAFFFLVWNVCTGTVALQLQGNDTRFLDNILKALENRRGEARRAEKGVDYERSRAAGYISAFSRLQRVFCLELKEKERRDRLATVEWIERERKRDRVHEGNDAPSSESTKVRMDAGWSGMARVICVQRVVLRVARSVYACICNWETEGGRYENHSKVIETVDCNCIYFYDSGRRSLEKWHKSPERETSRILRNSEL